jgi:hypothetical protein
VNTAARLLGAARIPVLVRRKMPGTTGILHVLEETIFPIEKCSGHNRGCTRLPTSVIKELVQASSGVALLFHVARSGQTDREERGWLLMQSIAVLRGELEKLRMMLAAV